MKSKATYPLRLAIVVLLSHGAASAAPPKAQPVKLGERNEIEVPTRWIVCDGTYGNHLQGVATDGESIFWSHTVKLVKTDLVGKLLHQVEVPSHHGDLTWHDGKVFVAVELGEFNKPAGKSDPWVYVYAAEDLKLLKRHRVPELVHGSGGIAYHDGRFVVVGGLPADHEANYLFEYDERFQFLKRHVLAGGRTKEGIQTAAYMDGHWWFGCYGSPRNPGVLKVDGKFNLVGESKLDYACGIVRFDASTVFRGVPFASNSRGKVELLSKALPEK